MGDRPTIAVLGGGQLGRMLGLAAIPLGVRCQFLDPSPEAPAAAVGDLTVGALDDIDAALRASKGADVATYEWEGVSAEVARAVAATIPVRPDPDALEVSQDRLTEKTLFHRLGIPTAPFIGVESKASLAALGFPAIVKTRRGGYDGKGQTVLQSTDEAARAWSELSEVPLIVEGWVPFERELSILSLRGLDGDTRHWPLVVNHHQGGILRWSRPTAGDHPLQSAAESYARAVLDDLHYVGVLAIELFEVDGQLLANEMAPRVHNSGHWTIEGSTTSQFENHVRAILGWPLGATARRSPTMMVNCVGTMPNREAVLAIPGAHFHDYGKRARPGRKLGHVTITADDDDSVDERVAQLRAALT